MIKMILIILFGVSVIFPQTVLADIIDPTKPLFMQTKKAPVKIRKKAPTKKVSKKITSPEVYVLTSTLVSKQRTAAVINNQIVIVGDKIGKATVVEINPALVLLKSGKRSIKLALSTYKVKKTIRSSMQLSPRRLQ